MAKIYESLKSAIDHKMIASAAATLGESESKITSAVHKILPSQLGVLLKKGATAHIDEVFKLAGKHKLFEKRGELFKGHGIMNDMNIGERDENALLGAHDPEYPAAIAMESGVSHESADRISNWIAGMIAGYMGERMIKEKVSLKTLLGELEHERGTIVRDIPSKVAHMFGISAPAAAHTASKPHTTAHQPKKKSYSWLIWLILLILALLIAFIWFRSCKNKKVEEVAHKVEQVTTPKVVDDGMTTLTLGDGTTMKVKKGGCEEKMINYLNSGKYKTATAADLKNNWIEFDRLDFEYNSTDKMLGDSEKQLDNIAAILKHYPDVKIKIGGYADVKGKQAVNRAISEGRANHVKSVFVSDGVSAARVSTVGFGEEYATVPANANDAQRAIDRNIALRFDK